MENITFYITVCCVIGCYFVSQLSKSVNRTMFLVFSCVTIIVSAIMFLPTALMSIFATLAAILFVESFHCSDDGKTFYYLSCGLLSAITSLIILSMKGVI